MKKIISIILASFMLIGSAAFAENIAFESAGNSKAVISLYNGEGSLVYSKLLENTDGSFRDVIPDEFSGATRRICYLDSGEFKYYKDVALAETPAPTSAPAPTPTAAPSDNPQATGKPTVMPVNSDYTEGGLYPKEVDGIYSPALIEDVELSVNSNDEEVYKLTVYFHGKKLTVPVEDDFGITSAPEAYTYLVGKTMDYLEKGDVVCITTNVSGTTVNSVDLITRPAAEDIVTGSADYGESFEKLVAKGGRVAGKWGYISYGESAGADRYEYAYGVVGKYTTGNLTLVNKNGETLDIDVDTKANVYICDVDGKEYETSIGSVSDITSDIPKKVIDADEIILDSDYSYNYALVRLVDKTATDIVLFNNYNN